MIFRIASLTSVVVAATFFTSCGNSSIGLVQKSKIGFVGNDNFKTAAPSSAAVTAAVNKPRDKHSMPVYSFNERNRIVRTTAYTCSEDDHLVYGSLNATGTNLRYNDKVRSAAADWSFYPVGTTFRIKGMPYLYVVDDYGSALAGTGTVDIYKPSKEVMQLWGCRNVELTIVQWGSFTRSVELLSKRTSYAHCSQMLANIVRQRPDLKSVAVR